MRRGGTSVPTRRTLRIRVYALAYGKSLLAQGQVGAAIFILEPQLNSAEVMPGLRETYADALVAAGRYADAEPLVWQLFELNPAAGQQVIALVGDLRMRSRTMPRSLWRANWSNSSGAAENAGSSSRSCRRSRRRTALRRRFWSSSANCSTPLTGKAITAKPC